MLAQSSGTTRSMRQLRNTSDPTQRLELEDARRLEIRDPVHLVSLQQTLKERARALRKVA